MKPQIKRKQIAEDTLKIIEQGYFLTPNQVKMSIKEHQERAVNHTRVYPPENTDQLIKNFVPQKQPQPTIFEVNGKTTLDATRQLIAEGHENVLLLNFASAKNAGGGFLGGAQAQEESIARASGLYPCLLNADVYYQANRSMRSCMYSDYMIYSPYVPIFKKENGENLDELTCATIITAPAVNAGVVRQREPDKIPLIELTMKRRIEKVLAISLANKFDVIVLGAWGCGVFRNDPDDMALYFKEVIETKFKNAFKKIVFAVYSRNERFITPFIKAFGS